MKNKTTFDCCELGHKANEHDFVGSTSNADQMINN